MTPQNTCATCDYFRTTVHGHGTCHIDPPGNSVRNGFPMVAATDWCAKGATAGALWNHPERETALLRVIEVLHEERKESGYERAAYESAAVRGAALVSRLLSRTLWQRICNTVPWDSPDRDKETPRR